MNIIFLEQTWGTGYGMALFLQYIEEVHQDCKIIPANILNIEKTITSEEDVIIYEEIHLSRLLTKILLLYPKNEIYLHNQYYELLHEKLSGVEYSHEELVNILKMLASKDDSVKLLGTNILERMPVDYLPFIYLCHLRFKIYNYAIFAIDKKISNIKLKNKKRHFDDFHQIKSMYPKYLIQISQAWTEVFG